MSEVTTATPGTVTITNPSGPIVNIDVTAGGGGTLTQVAAGTGISVAAGAGPIATVTNTGVLSLTAGSNIVLSGATGAVTVSSNVPKVLQSSMWDPKDVPYVDDEEFIVDPFLAGTWTVRLESSPSTVLTRAGDVDPTSSPSAGTYRSTLAKSTVWFQGPVTTGLLITKPVTALAAGTRTTWTYGISATFGSTSNVGALDTFVAAALRADNAGLPSTTSYSRLYINSGVPSTIGFEANGVTVSTSQGAVNNVNGRFDLLPLGGYGITNDAAAGVGHAWFFGRDDHIHYFMAPQSSSTVSVVGHAGFDYYCAGAGNAYSDTRGVVGFHFMRCKVGNAWPFTG